MSMDRRTFLRRSSLAVAGGLLVGDAALEAFERLTHRKVWALGGVQTPFLPHYMNVLYRKTYSDITGAMKRAMDEYSWVDSGAPSTLFDWSSAINEIA